ncbi:hypothetical protein [Aquihabitans sp. McL0605]|uniref:hypothetical protein n=1 Tax=Aquihabitans sp. McL0605 TaxID=3415671 RepID=UPI003CE781B4
MSTRDRALVSGGERGTTLIEVLLYVVMSGLIVGAIAGALTVGFRTTGATTERLAASHASEIVANSFPRDVASAAPAGITATPAATGCAGSDEGANVVRLPVSAGPGDDQRVVAYRFDSAQGDLLRSSCTVGAPATTDSIAEGVAAASATVETDTDGTTTVTLAVTLRAPAGQRFEVTGHSRTPTEPAALPDPAVPTTAPPLPCKVDSSSATPSPVAIASGTTLAADVSVSVSVSGSCVAPLTVSLTPGSGSAVTVPLIPFGTTYAASLGKAGYAWTSGTKTLTIGQAVPATVLNPTLGLTVSPPCTVAAATLTPNPAAMGAGSALAADVGVSLTTTGLCATPLSLAFTPGAAAPVTVALTASGSAYTASLGRSAYAWTAGTKAITVVQTGTVAVQQPTIGLTVSPFVPCTITSVVASPNPVGRAPNGRLIAPVAVTVATSGTCSGLQIKYAPQGTDTTAALTSSGSTWTATIATGPKWDPGSHTITILGASSAGSASLVVT